MISEYSKYGAISTKVSAMYGRRLRTSDWEALESMRSVRAVIEYLKKHPGWEKPLGQLPSRMVTRGEIEEILRDTMVSEYVTLYKFSSMADKKFMMFPVYKFEYMAILRRLRSLLSGITATSDFNISDFYKAKSKLDFTSLSVADNWNSIISAAKNTIYYQALVSAQPAHMHSLLDYTAVSTLLEGRFYEVMNRYALTTYQGKIKNIFVKALGEEIDLLNLIHLMRLKRYFSHSTQSPEMLLFPVQYKLKRDFFIELLSAPSYESAFSLLKNSYYGKFFREHSFDFIEDYFKTRIYIFNRKQLLSGTPSPYTSIAYLNLKEFEIKRLTSVIEQAYYAGTGSDLLG